MLCGANKSRPSALSKTMWLLGRAGLQGGQGDGEGEFVELSAALRRLGRGCLVRHSRPYRGAPQITRSSRVVTNLRWRYSICCSHNAATTTASTEGSAERIAFASHSRVLHNHRFFPALPGQARVRTLTAPVSSGPWRAPHVIIFIAIGCAEAAHLEHRRCGTPGGVRYKNSTRIMCSLCDAREAQSL